MMSGRMSLPPTFRYQLVERLLGAIRAGESTAVVGVASVGKSNLIHALRQADVQATHVGQGLAGYLFVWVDSNDLIEVDAWHFFELLLYRLAFQARKAQLATELVAQLDALHERLLASDKMALAQRCFEAALGRLCQEQRLKVVLLLDEFDLLFQALPERLLINLRALRDKNKYGLVYSLFLRQELATLRPALNQVEAFAELFQANTYYLKPYDLAGTELMLSRLSQRRRLEWPVEYTSPLFDLSGGHGGLLKLIFGKLWSQIEAGQSLRSDFLAADPEIDDECQKIWDCLTAAEQRVLGALARLDFSGRMPANSAVTVDKLGQKGLLRFDSEAQQAPQLFSPLFAAFVQRTGPVSEQGARFAFDIKSRTCWINNEEIALPALPAKLLELLYRHRGKPCRRGEILRYLYPNEDHSQLRRLSDDPRLYDVVKNLRKKIEPNPRKPRYVKTVRGMGFKLDI